MQEGRNFSDIQKQIDMLTMTSQKTCRDQQADIYADQRSIFESLLAQMDATPEKMTASAVF